jgi:hypothetical protein
MARTETAAQRARAYARDGFVLEQGLLERSEVEGIDDAFMRMHASGGVPGRYEPPPRERDYDDGVHYVFERGDPLARFPRVMKPHLFMPEIRAVALDPRLFDIVDSCSPTRRSFRSRCSTSSRPAHAARLSIKTTSS